ncbi:MAG: hypothetical protein ABL308_12350 [Oceanicaulis sp.]
MAAIDSTAANPARPSDELLPFLNNFHDIFTTIGVVILFSGLGLGAVQVMDAAGYDTGSLAFDVLWNVLAVAMGAAAWLLSSILVGKQRRILPGIVLTLVFAGSIGAVLAYVYTKLTFGEADFEAAFAGFDALGDAEAPTRAAIAAALADVPMAYRIWPVGVAACLTVPIAIYYAAFRLPFAGGLAGLGVVWIAFAALFVADPYTALVFNPLVSLLMGLTLFLAGIWFDARDPDRQTRLSGTGFWLHFFAAPTLLSAAVTIASVGLRLDEADLESAQIAGVFGAFAMEDAGAAVRTAAVTLAVIFAFAIVSLLINRRALIVSGLITAGVATAALVNLLGFDGAVVAAITLLLLGGFVVLLGAAWNPVRRVLLAPFPKSGPIARVFPPADGRE